MKKTGTRTRHPVGLTLLKALRDAGTGSRRDLASAIKAGRITVNDQPAENFNQPLVTSDTVKLDGRIIKLDSPALSHYVILNKPLGFLSTTDDPQGRRTVLDLLPAEMRQYRLFPVGRLDENTTGLMLLTNDGQLTYRLTHPRFGVEKEYLVAIDGSLSSAEIERAEKGLELDDGLSAPAEIKPVSLQPYNYRITIHEGRKRIIRRIFAALGHQVRELRRIRIGPVELKQLREGDCRRLNPKEVKRLHACGKTVKKKSAPR